MGKKKAYLIILVYIIVFILVLHQSPRAKAIVDSYIDPENDVFRIDTLNQNIEKVSTHPQLDITNIALNITSQYSNVTFLGNISGYNMECNIYFFKNYNPDNLVFEYGVHYSNFTGTGFKVILVKYILNGEEYDFEFWNNTINDWTPFNNSADSVGSFSDYTIEATIPQLAFTIDENTTWFVLSSSYEGSYIYLDAAPDSFSPIRETNGAFPFEIFIFAAVIIIVIFVFYFIRKKRLNRPL